MPFRAPFWSLAAAAAIVVAAAVVTATTQHGATAVAEQKDQDDDPPAVVATKAVVTHNEYLHEFFGGFTRSFQDIPLPRKGALAKTAAETKFLRRRLYYFTPAGSFLLQTRPLG